MVFLMVVCICDSWLTLQRQDVLSGADLGQGHSQFWFYSASLMATEGCIQSACYFQNSHPLIFMGDVLQDALLMLKLRYSGLYIKRHTICI